MNDDLISKVESLKVMFASRATGGVGDELEYKKLRRELTALPRISKLLPRFVVTCRDLSEFWSFIKFKFDTYAQRREYLRAEFDTLLMMLETESRAPSDAGITATVQAVSSNYIQEAWHKALDRRTTDAEGAITVSRTLLESVCKHILDAAGATYDDSADLHKLYTLTAKQLSREFNLLIDSREETERLEEQIFLPDFQKSIKEGESLNVWLVIRDQRQFESIVGILFGELLRYRSETITLQMEQSGVPILDRFAARLAQRSNPDWTKWQLCRFTEIALEIMCFGLCRAIRPPPSPESLFGEGIAATFGVMREHASKLAAVPLAIADGWGGRVLRFSSQRRTSGMCIGGCEHPTKQPGTWPTDHRARSIQKTGSGRVET